jgi:hypothetical protein
LKSPQRSGHAFLPRDGYLHQSRHSLRSRRRCVVYESSPLQRWLRDLHIAAPHATVQQRHYVAAGKAALAQYRRQVEDPWELAAQ